MKVSVEIDELQGRWSKKEHKLFIEGLHLYSRDWKKISTHIKTRNSSQVRSHAQKFFLKEEKNHPLKSIKKIFTNKPIISTLKKIESSTQYGEDMIFPSILNN